MPKCHTLKNYDLTYEQAHAIAGGMSERGRESPPCPFR